MREVSAPRAGTLSYNINMIITSNNMRILMLVFILFLTPNVLALPCDEDEQIKDALIKQSIHDYLKNFGNCPCPYCEDKDGHLCGGRSAWSINGGREPLCYPSDITKK